ncbi:hypothetical protein C7B77_18625 [Chamaesiphon polymorphus CCALA 037]|uniref:Uncharacterized protein n=1 Tax=Chamaesiphon polymorphus CCALA 037 TaxID=2107692 RepID=A0A2T1GAQ5_9CYAN|nr:hypothetical protein C7B77_18625 [Chamaesiphon polymorphus CCALA 037]
MDSGYTNDITDRDCLFLELARGKCGDRELELWQFLGNLIKTKPRFLYRNLGFVVDRDRT